MLRKESSFEFAYLCLSTQASQMSIITPNHFRRSTMNSLGGLPSHRLELSFQSLYDDGSTRAIRAGLQKSTRHARPGAIAKGGLTLPSVQVRSHVSELQGCAWRVCGSLASKKVCRDGQCSTRTGIGFLLAQVQDSRSIADHPSRIAIIVPAARANHALFFDPLRTGKCFPDSFTADAAKRNGCSCTSILDPRASNNPSCYRA